MKNSTLCFFTLETENILFVIKFQFFFFCFIIIFNFSNTVVKKTIYSCIYNMMVSGGRRAKGLREYKGKMT